MNNNEITPPPELVEQWAAKYWGDPNYSLSDVEKYIATQSARWAADRELNACCEWLVCNYNYPEAANPLRTARRPKQLSLKKRALAVLDDCSDRLDAAHENALRRALEALSDD